MEKKFTCGAICDNHSLDDAVCIGFAIAIGRGTEDRDDVRTRFDALQIGETLIDEDGDTWERIA